MRTAASALAILLLAGCGSLPPAPTSQVELPGTSGSADASPMVSPIPRLIAQPPVNGLTVAPKSARVDLRMPTFSHPTEITNPLFPVEPGSSDLFVGIVEHLPFRTEVTVLPRTRIIEWDGQRVETVVSQYNAFLDGRIHEIAYDLYAQADDGSVWYFGEDVFDFEDGRIADTEGTWHAGIDGPAAMIMPADPHVGDVYRTENIPGLVFEEVTVKQTGAQIAGPFGPIDGALLVEEHHADGSNEQKTFAPGYGEYYTAADGEVEALAMAVPTDAATDMPPVVRDFSNQAQQAVNAALSGRTVELRQMAASISQASGKLGDTVARRLRPVLLRAIHELSAAARGADLARAATAAIAVDRWSEDLRLRYQQTTTVDQARIGLWGAQLMADARAHDNAGVHADAFALAYTRERVMAVVAPDDMTKLNDLLGQLYSAMADGSFGVMARIGAQIRRQFG